MPNWARRLFDGTLVKGRAWHVLAAAAVVTALLGFFAGTRRHPLPEIKAPSAVPVHAERAPTYAELRRRNVGPNAAMYQDSFTSLHPAHDLFAVPPQTEADRRKALAARAARRAYDGAPPTVPHAIDQQGYPNCLACHANGAKLAGKLAPRMSHERYDNCVQCHVVGETPLPDGDTPTVDNGFVGLHSPERGERAWPGAPPTIPHRTQMRSQCMSCHGPGGQSGLRSTHPWRQSCTQCHAPSAELDRTPGSEHPSFLGALP